MDCKEARTTLGRGIADDAAVADHLADCEDCRAAAQAVAEADAILAPLFDVSDAPSPEGARRTSGAVRGEAGRPSTLRVFSRVAAALALLLVGGLGGWLLHSPAPSTGPVGLSSGLASHELEVFNEVREALGGDLAWLATVDGEVVVGLSPESGSGELRVVLIEVRDETGGVLTRLNVVVPDGREVEVAAPGAPRLRISVNGSLECALEFTDGARIETPGLELLEGETALLGKVRTDGAVRSVFVARF